ncbi:MAG: hypothetical protein IPP22_09460 [Nitrosomonas sp.]|nr:hypothetical protein [Nitrosomonas sp.]
MKGRKIRESCRHAGMAKKSVARTGVEHHKGRFDAYSCVNLELTKQPQGYFKHTDKVQDIPADMTAKPGHFRLRR